MDIIQIVGIALVGIILIAILTQYNKDFGLYIRIALGVIIFFVIFSKLTVAIELLNEIISKTKISGEYVKIIFKVIGIAYVTEFGSQICKDASETAIAAKIEMAGKLSIMMISIPIISAIVSEVSNFMG